MAAERSQSLLDQLGITPSDLEGRKAWNVFTREHVEILIELRELAFEHADEISNKFYDHSFSFPAFAKKVQESGSSRAPLVAAQAQYFKDLFSGTYDIAYAERRLHIGAIHHKLAISPRYYLGSYIQFYDLFFPILAKKYKRKPGRLALAISAFLKIVNFDQQLMIEGYTMGFVNEMKGQVEKVRTQASEARKNTDAILTSMVQVSQAMSQLASGSAEQAESTQSAAANVQSLSEVISNVSNAASEQAEQAKLMNAQVDNLKSAISQIDESVRVGIETAETAANTSRAGVLVVKETVDGMDRIRQRVEDGTSLISELGAKSDEIGKIISVIEDVADQTNLLALNAAIEAARAGEQGRGFAVVADEVRKLAERVAGATKEIAELIGVVQDGVKESVTAMNKGTEEVAEGTELVTKAGDSLNEILNSVQSTNDQVNEIGAASRTMNEATENVVSLVEGVASASLQTAASSQEMNVLNAEVTRT
ncbi:MAG: hypothetical protein IIB27_05305, partial [Chloroflexi bacterium]|nr:hypothetical protein [Chloroflexota bacterium]